MEVEVTSIPEMSLEEFADEHRLKMVAVERRNPSCPAMRWYAHFDRAEIKDGDILIGATGNGCTQYDAMEEYAEEISMRTLIINAYSDERRSIKVPRLVSVSRG